MTTDPASLLPSIACQDCGVTSGLCVYTSGPNAGKPRAARYGPHKVRVDDSTLAARWYDRGVSAGAASRQPDVDAARSRAESAERALAEAKFDAAHWEQEYDALLAKYAPAPEPEPLSPVEFFAVRESWKDQTKAWLAAADDLAQAGTFDKGTYLKKGAWHRDNVLIADTKVPWSPEVYAAEIAAHKTNGIDGWFLDVTTPKATDQNFKVILAEAKACAANDFGGIPMIDTNGGGIKTMTPEDVAAALLPIYKLGIAKRGGEQWLHSFMGANPPGVDYWTRLLAALEKGLGEPVRFIASLVHPDGAKGGDGANLKTYAPIADVIGWWGSASPAGTATDEKYAALATDLEKKLITSARYQDVRPYASQFGEAGNTELLRTSLGRAVKLRPRFVSINTSNDLAETSHFTLSRNHGDALLRATAYFAEWTKTGKQPVIAKDWAILTHRIHKVGAPVPAGQDATKPSLGGTPRDTAGLCTFLTTDAEVSINGAAPKKVPAGVFEVTEPLSIGQQTAVVTRNGVEVFRIESPFQVVATPKRIDMDYRAVVGE